MLQIENSGHPSIRSMSEELNKIVITKAEVESFNFPSIPPPPPPPVFPPPPPFYQSNPYAQNRSIGELASFTIRFGAYFIDSIIANILAFISVFAIFSALRAGGITSSDAFRVVWTITSMFTTWLYYALMESSSKQATLGKMACGLVVTDLQGRRIGFWQASGRRFGMFISSFTLGIGFLMCAWTAKKQCLHDMMAGCLVFKK